MQVECEQVTKYYKMKNPPKGFNDKPYPYHHEIIIEIEDVTNLGVGIARINNWVIHVAYVIPGEKVKARIFRNHKNYSEADCIEIIKKSPDRVDAKCSLFQTCGGCQYQNVRYETQLEWKRSQISQSFKRLADLKIETLPVFPSPKRYGYRSKLTPHFEKTRPNKKMKLGFLKYGTRHVLVDIPQCPIATDRINEKLPTVRKNLFFQKKQKKGGTVLLRDTFEGVVTDSKQIVCEKIGNLTFQFKAGEFFQNNPFILPDLVKYVIDEARDKNINLLVDAYCGGGLFSLSAAKHFNKIVGIEISREGFDWACANAKINNVDNAHFILGDAASIFEDLNKDHESSLIIDPPRKGCDENFINQTLSFKPKKIIYVSCEPSTQARDSRILVDGGYNITRVQPFDLFPQTRHVENVVTFVR